MHHKTKLPRIPALYDTDDMGTPASRHVTSGEFLPTLCANWVMGCNCITNGATPDGRLTLCYDCQEEQPD